ncbi:acyl-CoA dehydrogenase family protein [Arvimicrobium flavum]|uniref:acyl-CoA dehydrogenase family protein n=1 Tax=Arvimicrobium flavum TaxID=3393320 RepID=UPI00237A97D7|nr:acyl-CoA dehydrogenase [Mesorhizobium shangrilense]
MDFTLSEERRLLSESLRRYFSDNYDLARRNAHANGAPYHAASVWSDLAGLGVMGGFVSEADGGFGGGAAVVAVIFEEIGRALCAEPLLGTLMGVRLLAGFGRHDLVEAIVSGESRAALAVVEPQVACNLDAIEAQARQAGDGWLLSGRKSAVYGAPGADLLLVAARSEAGIGLFLVRDAELAATSMIDGGGVADIVMEGLPAECLAADALPAIDDVLDLGRIALGAEAVGAMDRLIEMTIDYVRQRRQFGRALSSFQELRHRVVDMVMELEQCRSIIIRAAASFGTPDQARHAAMAKNLIGRMGPRIAEEAIQLHGGIGMTWEYPVSHYAKRLVMIDHQLGDRHDHALRLAAMPRGAEAA